MRARALTAEELREMFLTHVRVMAQYWSERPNMSALGMCEGVAFSILTAIDGDAMALPAWRLTADPHPDDKEYLREEGINWPEPGTCITDGVALHELFHKRE